MGKPSAEEGGREAIYDWLVALFPKMTAEPAVVRLGDRCVIGRWVTLGENRNGLILASRTQAIEVLGWGSTWPEAKESATRRLAKG